MSNLPIGTQVDTEHAVAADLQGCWLYNEGSGSYANNISTMTTDDNLINASSNSWATSGYCNFSSASSQIHRMGINPANSVISFLIRFKMTQSSNLEYYYGVHSGDNDLAAFILRKTTGNKLEFYGLVSGNYIGGECNTVLQTGTEYTVIGIFDGTNSYIYLNGTLDRTADSCGPIDTDAGGMAAAGRWANTSGSYDLYANMSIDRIYYWARALSSSDRTALASDIDVFLLLPVPLVTTSSPTWTSSTTATGNGNVTDDNGSTVTERGVCWSTSPDPTISDSHAAASAGGEGAFTASMTGLTAGESYYVRSYATSENGTGYGDNVLYLQSQYFVFGDATKQLTINTTMLTATIDRGAMIYLKDKVRDVVLIDTSYSTNFPDNQANFITWTKDTLGADTWRTCSNSDVVGEVLSANSFKLTYSDLLNSSSSPVSGTSFEVTVTVDTDTGEIVIDLKGTETDYIPTMINFPLMNFAASDSGRSVILSSGYEATPGDGTYYSFATTPLDNSSNFVGIGKTASAVVGLWSETTRVPKYNDVVVAHHYATYDHLSLRSNQTWANQTDNEYIIYGGPYRIGTFATWLDAAKRWREQFEAVYGAEKLWESSCSWLRNIHCCHNNIAYGETTALLDELAAVPGVTSNNLMYFYWNLDRYILALDEPQNSHRTIFLPTPEILTALQSHGWPLVGGSSFTQFETEGPGYQWQLGQVTGTIPSGWAVIPDYPGTTKTLAAFYAWMEDCSTPAFTANVTGTHKTGYDNSAFYVDSAGRNLVTAGVAVGQLIKNVTDGSKGLITAIGNQDATNDKITVTLEGGTDNDFDADDVIAIIKSNYAVIHPGSTKGQSWLLQYYTKFYADGFDGAYFDILGPSPYGLDGVANPFPSDTYNGLDYHAGAVDAVKYLKSQDSTKLIMSEYSGQEVSLDAQCAYSYTGIDTDYNNFNYAWANHPIQGALLGSYQWRGERKYQTDIKNHAMYGCLPQIIYVSEATQAISDWTKAKAALFCTYQMHNDLPPDWHSGAYAYYRTKYSGYYVRMQDRSGGGYEYVMEVSPDNTYSLLSVDGDGAIVAQDLEYNPLVSVDIEVFDMALSYMPVETLIATEAGPGPVSVDIEIFDLLLSLGPGDIITGNSPSTVQDNMEVFDLLIDMPMVTQIRVGYYKFYIEIDISI